jgi:hypothetical protein
LSAVPERFPAETAVRCLCCKTDLADPEQLRLHLAVPGCTGPIYAKNAVLPPPRDSDQPLQVFRGRYYFFFFFMYNIQHRFICRPSDSTVSDRTQDGCDYTALSVRHSNHSARSHPRSALLLYIMATILNYFLCLVRLCNDSCPLLFKFEGRFCIF